MRHGVANDILDRAFAATELRSRYAVAEERADAAATYARVRERSLDAHAEIRASIREGRLDREAFLASLMEAPVEIRDHLVEEILDIAYPPLEERLLLRDAFSYTPSGLAEILFAIDHAKLDARSTLLDLGSGLGKVGLLATILTGATTIGLELDPALVMHANVAAESLGLENARFAVRDIREGALPPADVYYMYLPLFRSDELVAKIAGVAETRAIRLYSHAIDVGKTPALRRANAGCYWLEAYEGG